ncbi:hypothetical protein ADM98_00785 [Exiguobacterium sp. BMC-KP]|uniref:hypothetical protein n=1 Tax=Exiguobacterium sp. BMC-KP TaxID=1684312 RepID=UPI0006AA156D|nr:hypothetical protein [Exiguobacterium sp. BMC-KP]KOP31416.1 hypothetical protein ADM98_00785 [Exiguobacterium sp. BMC-KP]
MKYDRKTIGIKDIGASSPKDEKKDSEYGTGPQGAVAPPPGYGGGSGNGGGFVGGGGAGYGGGAGGACNCSGSTTMKKVAALRTSL